MKRVVTLVAALALALGFTGLASADPIEFIHIGQASGAVGEFEFFDSAFTIVATGDTINRQDLGFGYFIDHDTATIDIDGVGLLTFITPTRTFVNNGNEIVGFSRAGFGGADLFNGPNNAAFATWDMLSSIGPFTGPGTVLQWTLSPVIETDRGILTLETGPATATFEARTGLVPEPTVLTLLGAGLFGAALLRRRRT